MKTLLTPKINPDLDGVACAYAYQKLLAKSSSDYIAVIYGKPHVEAQYVIKRFNINDIVFDSNEDFDKFILCDASDLLGMPTVLRGEDVLEIIDHRSFYDSIRQFPNATITIEPIGAAATIIVEKYMQTDAVIDFNSAILLYGAIYSNTLNLKGSVTTQRDTAAIHWIESKVDIPENFIQDMFAVKTNELLKNLREDFINDSKALEFKNIRYGISQLEVINASELLANKKEEILKILHELKHEHNLTFNFLTIADISNERNIFITDDTKAQEILSKALHVNFENAIGYYNGLILRKQIVPIIQEKF